MWTLLVTMWSGPAADPPNPSPPNAAGPDGSVEGEFPYSLINTVGSGDNPQGGDDGAPTQVVALELKASLPGPLCE